MSHESVYEDWKGRKDEDLIGYHLNSLGNSGADVLVNWRNTNRIIQATHDLESTMRDLDASNNRVARRYQHLSWIFGIAGLIIAALQIYTALLLSG
jgi:methionine synthase I (cobalamin-dependent)